LAENKQATGRETSEEQVISSSANSSFRFVGMVKVAVDSWDYSRLSYHGEGEYLSHPTRN
jgi:hypothetical protein